MARFGGATPGGPGDITGMRQRRGRDYRPVAHLPIGTECGEMQRHIGAEGIRQPAAQRIDLAIGIVLAGINNVVILNQTLYLA